MTVEPPNGAAASTPAAKSPAPDLRTRAPRPIAVRLRPALIGGAGLAAAAVCGGALVWSFVVHPHQQRAARTAASATANAATQGVARPSKAITDHPDDYSKIEVQGSTAPASAASPSGARPAGPEAASAAPVTAHRSLPPRRTAGVRDEARGSDLFFRAATAPTAAPPRAGLEPEVSEKAQRPDAVRAAVGDLIAPVSPFEVKAGAILPGVLVTAVDTARPGPVVAMLSEDLFDSVAGRHLLAPQGSRLIGRTEGASRYGDRRAFISWERMILPNGKSVTLAHEPGVDEAGAVGAPGRADRRLGPLAIATLFAGAITTLGQAARDRGSSDHSLVNDAGDAAAIDAARVGGRLVEREMDVAPSIRLSAGARVRVLMTHDLVLEPYRP